MEGQNKRDHVDIECCECGDVFPVGPDFIEGGVELERIRCPDCEEGV